MGLGWRKKWEGEEVEEPAVSRGQEDLEKQGGLEVGFITCISGRAIHKREGKHFNSCWVNLGLGMSHLEGLPWKLLFQGGEHRRQSLKVFLIL